MQVKRGEKLKGAPFRFSLFRPSILVAPSTQARMITQYPKIQEFLGAVFCASVCGACCWAEAKPKRYIYIYIYTHISPVTKEDSWCPSIYLSTPLPRHPLPGQNAERDAMLTWKHFHRAWVPSYMSPNTLLCTISIAATTPFLSASELSFNNLFLHMCYMIPQSCLHNPHISLGKKLGIPITRPEELVRVRSPTFLIRGQEKDQLLTDLKDVSKVGEI